MKMGKKLAAAALALALIFSCVSVFAEGTSSTPAAVSETVAKLLKVPDFKFFVREDGIGKGSAPVYTAPSEDSIRLADGKASCSVETEIAVAGHVDHWLLVRYETNNGGVRVGYIPPQYSKKLKSGRGNIDFDAISVQLAEDITITDNPRHNSKPYGTLSAGTEIIVLGKYTYSGNWWYIETMLDGQLTRGFINRSEAALQVDGTVYHGNEELGFPVTSPENTRQIGMITIKGNAENAMKLREKASTDSKMVARVFGGESFPCYKIDTLNNGKQWYYIWVDGVWGWFSAGASTLDPAE